MTRTDPRVMTASRNTREPKGMTATQNAIQSTTSVGGLWRAASAVASTMALSADCELQMREHLDGGSDRAEIRKKRRLTQCNAHDHPGMNMPRFVNRCSIAWGLTWNSSASSLISSVAERSDFFA